jgi:hypothetical protein
MLISISIYSQSQKDYVGTWQSSAVLGSGWSDSYLFFEDGTFKFFYSQMDCSKREVSFSGNWLAGADEIQLIITNSVMLEGGEMVVSTGSCGSDSTLINAVEKIITYDPPLKNILQDAKYFLISIDGVEEKTLTINGKRFWYYGDPKEMLKQFEN